MAYIGNQPGTGVRNRFIYTATASQTTFTGADNNSKTLKYSDADYIDVYLNGVCLVPVTDYAASTKTSVVLVQAASLNDTLEVVAYDIATISDTVSKADGGTFEANVTFAAGADILTASAGTDNVRLGEDAGASIASGGNQNTLIGKDAGTAITTGDDNVAVGHSALKTEDANGRNTAVGFEALTTLNAGADGENVAVGYRAGKALTEGIQNTLIGVQAGDALTHADYNVAVGRNALSGDTQGHKSTAVGVGALNVQNHTSSTDTHNTAVGYNAGQAVTTGHSNTIVGSNASYTETTGDENTAVGGNALYTASTPNGNTAVGHNAGYHITTGAKNTLVGRFNGNENGLDIRTSSNNIVLSDGDGTPRVHDNGVQFKVLGDSQNNGICSIINAASANPYGVSFNFTGAAPNSTTEYFANFADSGGVRCQIKSNGNLQNVNNSYGAYSDQKLKENIVDSGSQWNDIKAVRVRKFSLKADELDTANKLGVIAQELEASGMNGLVTTEPDIDEETRENLGTETKSVQYSVLYMKAVKALQEAMTRIETLETKVAALEAE